MPIRDKLLVRIPKPKTVVYGIADEDIARIRIVPELADEIIDCLRSEDEVDVIFGLLFAKCLGCRKDFYVISESSMPEIVMLIRSSLKHSSLRVRVEALSAFVAFHESYSDYSLVMHEFLRAPDSQIRRVALQTAPSFLSPKELGILLSFCKDTEIGESGGMGGPLRYGLRDLALEVAENISGKQFDRGDCFEKNDRIDISWRNWSGFRQWLEDRKK